MSILSGIRVIDLTRLISGPFVTRLLADFGAEVIKIQSPKVAKGMEDPEGIFFRYLNRNKKGATLNLDTAEGRELLLRLVEKSDLLVENFSPRVMENFGLTYRRMRSRNRGLIVLSISSFGRKGPWRNYVGFSHTFHALSGLTHLLSLGFKEPVEVGFAYADWLIGLFGSIAALAALAMRRRTGEGQFIDLSGFEAMVSLLGDWIVSPQKATGFPKRICVKCKDGRFCAVSLSNEDDLRYFLLEVAGVGGHLEGLCNLAEGIVSELPAKELEGRLREKGIQAAAVRSLRDVVEDKGLRDRGFLIEKDGGTWLRSPLRGLSQVELGPAPKLGEHNRYVFLELLGMEEEEFENYRQKGVI